MNELHLSDVDVKFHLVSDRVRCKYIQMHIMRSIFGSHCDIDLPISYLSLYITQFLSSLFDSRMFFFCFKVNLR